MQVKRTTESEGVIAFASKLEDRQGGGTLSVAAHADGAVIKAGTCVYKDSDGLFCPIKSAAIQANATNSATEIRVEKGSHAVVGEHFGFVGDVSKTITAIDTDNASYDEWTLNATLGVVLTAGQVLTQVSAAAADNAALIDNPDGMTGFDVEVAEGDNHPVQIVMKGTAIESNIPPIHATVKALLPQITYAI